MIGEEKEKKIRDIEISRGEMKEMEVNWGLGNNLIFTCQEGEMKR